MDGAGNTYVAGYTSSTDFPTLNALQGILAGSTNAFVSKVNPSGSALVYSTYLGGGASDDAFGIAVDASGNAYVTGNAGSSNFPTLNAFQGSTSSRYRRSRCGISTIPCPQLVLTRQPTALQLTA